QDGHPVGRQSIMHKASQMMTIVHDLNQPYQLSSGWYERFLCGHSELKTGKSRILSKARNSFDVDTVVDFYHELVHSMSLVGFEHSRVYNMDVTSFSPNKVSRNVVVHRNSAKVYVEEASHQHMSPLWHVSAQMAPKFHRFLCFLVPA
ncbi:hypothetical protein DYB32_010791, partial [Aphanomyces invadans]